MSFVVRGLLGVASVVCPTLAQAQTAPSAPPTAPAPPPTTAPAATAPPATAPPATAAAPVRVYMRNEGSPLTFSAHAESAAGAASAPSWCISPCDVRLSPGDYRL
ncbi:MAG TPA: hypothetical protein VGJ91_12915, partial [Polyangiaceae bacterium]